MWKQNHGDCQLPRKSDGDRRGGQDGTFQHLVLHKLKMLVAVL